MFVCVRSIATRLAGAALQAPQGRCSWSGDVAFFSGASLNARASVPSMHRLSACCFTRRRTIVAMSFDSGHDAGG